jgi:hypothetical protein
MRRLVITLLALTLLLTACEISVASYRPGLIPGYGRYEASLWDNNYYAYYVIMDFDNDVITLDDGWAVREERMYYQFLDNGRVRIEAPRTGVRMTGTLVPTTYGIVMSGTWSSRTRSGYFSGSSLY